MPGIEQVFGAVGGVAVTTSDTVNFVDKPRPASRGLLVAVTGNYKVTMEDDSEVTWYLAAGMIHPIRCRRVWTTGAASTSGIVAAM